MHVRGARIRGVSGGLRAVPRQPRQNLRVHAPEAVEEVIQTLAGFSWRSPRQAQVFWTSFWTYSGQVVNQPGADVFETICSFANR